MINKIKIMTVLGTRPEIIRMSVILNKFDKYFDSHVVNTLQNDDLNLNYNIFHDLHIKGKICSLKLNSKLNHIQKTIKIMSLIERQINLISPDVFFVLGDTNSSLTAMIAKKMKIPVFHMEAGNRCFGRKSPEEVNRKIIDHSSDILLPYTKDSKGNLLNEGIKNNKIIVTGNPITEVIHHNKFKINKSKIIKILNLKQKRYLLLTLHREENADDFRKLKSFLIAFNQIVKKFDLKIIWPVHPRTRKILKQNKFNIDKRVILLKPLGFIDFISLEKNCLATISDSGTVQEESAIFKKPCLVIREYTERPETIRAGSAIILNNNVKKMKEIISKSLKDKIKIKNIKDYSGIKVSNKILEILKNY